MTSDRSNGAYRAPALSVIVIGRDEGANVSRALASAMDAVDELPARAEIIYVDSGSQDDSVERARAFPAVRVVAIPRETASAARARNAGISFARGRYVQLLDGDMVLDRAWLDAGWRAIRTGRAAAVVGRLVERPRHPTPWNRAFGLDWSRELGEVETVGGAALWQRSVLVALGGFDETLAVGEDPELCLRARALGHRLVALDAPMADHDLGLRTATDWWRRAVRVGESRASVAFHHPRYRPARRELVRPVLWTGLGATAAVVGASLGPRGLLVIAALALLVLARRTVLDMWEGHSPSNALIHALHVYAVKFPIAFGVVRRWTTLRQGASL